MENNGPLWRHLVDTVAMVLNVEDNRPQKQLKKVLIFTAKWATTWLHGVREASMNTHLRSFDSPIAVEEEQPSLETPTWDTGDRPELSGGSFWKQAENGPFWRPNWPCNRPDGSKITQNLLQVLCSCSAVVLGYLDAILSHGVPKKTFYPPAACCC